MEHLLEVKNLSVSIDGPAGEVQAVREVSFSLKKGEVLAIVGESGCGKSVLCKSIMKLLPPSAKIKEGSICVNGQDKDGMPVGMQLLGQTFDEKSIIRAAYAFECTKTYKRPDALGTVEAERGLA